MATMCSEKIAKYYQKLLNIMTIKFSFAEGVYSKLSVTWVLTSQYLGLGGLLIVDISIHRLWLRRLRLSGRKIFRSSLCGGGICTGFG